MSDAPVPATERFARHAGEAARTRPAPSAPAALAGFAALVAGLALAVLGIDVVLRGGSRVGVGITFAGYAAAGLVLAASPRRVLRSAGVAAVTTAVPGLFGFLLLEFDETTIAPITSTLALSTVAWGVLHLAGPTRGHAVTLGAACVGLWATVLAGLDVLAAIDTAGGHRPGVTAAAVASLVIGSAYAGVGGALARERLAGTAAPFLAAAVLGQAAGLALLGFDHSRVVVGLTGTVTGTALAVIGHRIGSRAAAGSGAAAVAGGVALVATLGYDGDVRGPAAAVVAAMVILIAGSAAVSVSRRPEPDNPLDT